MKKTESTIWLSPTEYCLTLFESVGISQAKLAVLIGTSKQNISNWIHIEKKTKQRGEISNDFFKKQILALAKEHKLNITSDDVIFGREVKNVFIEQTKSYKKQKFYF